MKKIIIIGAGTFSTVVIDSILENQFYADYTIEGFLDDGQICDGNFDYPLLGKIDDAEKFNDKETYFVLSIGSPKIRQEIVEKYPYLNYMTVIDKSANISKYATIGKGCVIMKNASINTLVRIDDFAIVNTGAIVDHHVKVGRYTHVGQGVVLWHSAQIKDGEHLLPGTVIKG